MLLSAPQSNQRLWETHILKWKRNNFNACLVITWPGICSGSQKTLRHQHRVEDEVKVITNYNILQDKMSVLIRSL